MEQLVMVLVFALASAICIRAFVLSDQLSRRSEIRDRAVVAAETAAEEWKAAGGDAAQAAKTAGGAADGAVWTVCYDKDWEQASGCGADAPYTVTVQSRQGGPAGLRQADVSVADGSGTVLFSLTAACQAEAAS